MKRILLVVESPILMSPPPPPSKKEKNEVNTSLLNKRLLQLIADKKNDHDYKKTWSRDREYIMQIR